MVRLTLNFCTIVESYWVFVIQVFVIIIIIIIYFFVIFVYCFSLLDRLRKSYSIGETFIVHTILLAKVHRQN